MILWSSACSASSVGAGTSTKTGSPSVRRSSLKYPGRGTPYGLAKVPVIKVATRSDLARRWHDLMDVNAGRIADGDATIEDVGWELFRLMLNVGAPVHAVEHQTVQVDVQVRGRPETLDQRDRAAVGLLGLQPGLIEQETRDGTVHDLQHRRHQLGLCSQQQPQRDRK